MPLNTQKLASIAPDGSFFQVLAKGWELRYALAARFFYDRDISSFHTSEYDASSSREM